MGLVSKLKNILFEEEEVEIPVIEKKPVVPKEAPIKAEVPQNYNNFYEREEPVVKAKEEVQVDRFKHQEAVSDREIFKSEKTFNFPAFDEEEFKSVVPPKRSTNVIEHERVRQEKRVEYNKPLKKEEERPAKAKFKPSPIISPVYGILDKNYTPDEITSRTTQRDVKTLDVDSVRKKAFGSLEEVTEEKEILEEKILEEKLEKARTIDELLKDSSDEVINTFDDVLESEPFNEEIDSLDEIEPMEEEKMEDTLENDLFDLIDSMYENRKDGE